MLDGRGPDPHNPHEHRDAQHCAAGDRHPDREGHGLRLQVLPALGLHLQTPRQVLGGRQPIQAAFDRLDQVHAPDYTLLWEKCRNSEDRHLAVLVRKFRCSTTHFGEPIALRPCYSISYRRADEVDRLVLQP